MEALLTGTNVVFAAQRHMSDRKLSIQELAGRIGMSRTALSQYLGGKYSNPETVEDKLLPYLQENGAMDSLAADPFGCCSPRFFQSSDARRIVAVCSACQEYAALGVITGKSGYGKTYTLQQYASLPNVAYIECDDTMGRRDLIETLEQVLGLNQGYGSLYGRTNAILAFLNRHPGYLLIVDEADKLISRSTQKKMEILRKLFDKSKVGIVVAGEPQLEMMLKSFDARFANRGNYAYRMSGLTKDEVSGYLSVFPMEQAAKDVFIERATGSRSGCFRLLERTLSNVIRLVRERREERITLALVEEASDMMML